MFFGSFSFLRKTFKSVADTPGITDQMSLFTFFFFLHVPPVLINKCTEMLPLLLFNVETHTELLQVSENK